MEQLALTSRDIVLLLAGYYSGKRNSTIIEPQAVKKNEEKVNSYCYQHREATVMDVGQIYAGCVISSWPFRSILGGYNHRLQGPL
jgi:hypothetical protein